MNCPVYLICLVLTVCLPPAVLEVGVSPLCREPLGWMFSRLDTNFDLQLDQSEIKSLYLDRKEPCSDVFFQSCDAHADKVLTSSEWCSCFQRYTGEELPTVAEFPLRRARKTCSCSRSRSSRIVPV